MDPVRNFAKVTVDGGYDATATTINLIAGDGDKLPDPATEGAFNLVWYNDSDYKDPADDPNVEIIRVTAKSGDTLTIERGQEGTSAVNHNTAGKTYKMILSMTEKMVGDIRNALSALFQGDIAPLRARAQSTPDMTVYVNPAVIQNYFAQVNRDNQPVTFAGGNSPTVTAPTTNDRIDILYLDSTGSLAWVTGTESATPSADWSSLPSDGIPICLVYCKTTMTKIVNYEDKDSYPNDGYIYQDVRPFISSGNKILADITVSSDCTYVDITGLDINTHGAYELICKLKNPTGSNTGYYLYVEGDYTTANYYNQWLYANNTTISANKENNPNIGQGYAGDRSFFAVKIVRDVDGYFRYLSFINRKTGGNIELVIRSGCKTAPVTNITQLRISAAVTDAIGAGSRIILRRVL